MRVLKFGGTSVANADRLVQVYNIINGRFDQDGATCAVVSAFSGMTDLLLQTVNLAESGSQDEFLAPYDDFVKKVHSVARDLLADNVYRSIRMELDNNHIDLKNLLHGVSLIQEASLKTKDFVVSFGERNSAFLLATYCKTRGHDAQYIDARQYIKTNNQFGAAVVNFPETNALIKELDTKGKINIITGFIGSDTASGVTTTLGRGGSDYSAAIFAAALDATALEIWTDVNGVLTSDPRKVKKAYSIPQLSYQEAAEMSHFGAKVLYGPTIRPVKEKGIATHIKNTFEPDHPGTIIHHSPNSSSDIISGISSIKDIAIVTLQGNGMQGVPGIAQRLFKSMADADISVVMITQASSEHSISIAIPSSDIEMSKAFIEKEFEHEISRLLIEPIHIKTDLSLIAIIGANMKQSPGVAGQLFYTLGKNGINVEAIAQGSSELNITCAVNKSDEHKALNAIHDAFFLSEYKTVHLYIVGVGLIGSTLLRQIKNHYDNIKTDRRIEFVINGLSNSRKMVFSDDGFGFTDYMDNLNQSDEVADIDQFIDKMIADNHASSIFVDNTASEIIPQKYARILEANISISTPNKIALSSSLEQYKKLKALSQIKHTPIGFETNVGAGLPIISTLKSLTTTGDKIEKIEAVLSGSLSYIFNTFDGKMSFADKVREAQEKGFTEPDPRTDLSGLDVKRKLLILSREAGFDLEADDIIIDSILSEEALSASSVDAFYNVLETDDSRYKALITTAQTSNQKLRFIASYDGQSGSISLQSVDNQNPFFGLNGSDNMIVIYSSRYNDTPLVVRGPGAGAEVTAAGLFAELLTIGENI